jgi:hypothetical protein
LWPHWARMATCLTKFLPNRAAPHPTAKVRNSTVRPLRRLAGGQAGVGLHRRCAALSDLHTPLPCHRLTRLSSSPGHRWRCFGRRVRRTSTRSSRIGSSVSGVSQRARSSGGNCTREGVSVNRLCKSTGELRVAGGGKGGGMRSRCVKSWTPARVCRLRSCRRSSPWCEPSGPERQGEVTAACGLQR